MAKDFKNRVFAKLWDRPIFTLLHELPPGSLSIDISATITPFSLYVSTPLVWLIENANRVHWLNDDVLLRRR